MLGCSKRVFSHLGGPRAALAVVRVPCAGLGLPLLVVEVEHH